MDIGVIQPVDNQRGDLKLVRSVYQVGGGITLGIFRRGLHVTLGIDRVVIIPAGGGRTNYAGFENIRGVNQGKQAHVSAKGFAIAADAVSVNVWQGAQVFDPSQLVVERGFAQLAGDGGLEGVPASETAAVIQSPDDKAGLGVQNIRARYG